MLASLEVAHEVPLFHYWDFVPCALTAMQRTAYTPLLPEISFAHCLGQAELDALKSQPSPLAIVESKKADFISDIGKFNKLISSQQAHQQVRGH